MIESFDINRYNIVLTDKSFRDSMLFHFTVLVFFNGMMTLTIIMSIAHYNTKVIERLDKTEKTIQSYLDADRTNNYIVIKETEID